MNASKLHVALLGAVLVAVPAGAGLAGEEYDPGKREYDENCASCHGPLGKGDGAFRELLKTTVPDLTVLAKNNGGVFPVGRIYEVIDGRQQVASHGPREMPIWGADYSALAAPAFDDYPFDTEVLVRARILALMEYLYRLQAK
jgi:mono/diheme cytochrome c family protein